MSKEAVVITTNDWTKLEILKKFTEENKKSDWRFGKNPKYLMYLNGLRNINVYFTKSGEIRYCAKCEKIIVDLDYNDLSLIPKNFQHDPTKYAGHIIIQRLDAINPPRSNESFKLVKSKGRLANRLYYGKPLLVYDRNLDYPEESNHASEKWKTRKAPLSEDAYYRESSQNLKVIIPRHKRLSNLFCDWLQTKGVSKFTQERNQVDVFFKTTRMTFLAELKVCYSVGTTKSIREALGQLLEYNFYKHRKPADRWVIILDEKPSKTDIEFIERIIRSLSLPLTLGWLKGNEFNFAGNLPF